MMNQVKQDHGYSWVVLVSAFLSQTIVMGVSYSNGVFYVLFLENINTESKSTLAFIAASISAIAFLTGPVSAALTKHFGCRLVHILGGFLASIGLIISAYSTNVIALCISFTFLTGFGYGLCFITSLDIIGKYFDKRRSLALSLTCSGAGFGTLIMPPTIRFLANVYNYQGAVLLVAAMSLHLIPIGVIFKPLESTRSKRKWPTSDKTGRQRECASQFDCSLFCDLTYILLCIANFVTTLSSSVIFVHLAAYAQSMGFNGDVSAMLYSGIGFTNFGARIIYSFLGLNPKMKPLLIYDIILLATATCTLLGSMAKSYIWLMVYAVSFGIYAACQAICVPTFLVEYYSSEKLSSSFGYVMAFQAIGQSSGGPLASLLYSYTGVYQPSFYLAAAGLAFSGIILIYPTIYTTCQKKHKPVVTSDIEEQPT